MCEKKLCGECRFRNDEGWCGNSTIDKFSQKDPNVFISYPGSRFWVSKNFGCIFWEKKSVEGELKTCHFCGSLRLKMDLNLPEFGLASLFIRCLNCGARGPVKFSMPEAVKAWDRIGKIEDQDE
jgi:hypothetical protein